MSEFARIRRSRTVVRRAAREARDFVTVDADRARFERHAAAKLAWACTMWLACDELDCSGAPVADGPRRRGRTEREIPTNAAQRLFALAARRTAERAAGSLGVRRA
eukprot:CAMPEP_0180049240 /NCGR_PEP_ID=MMETSP0984-20121128/38716_1 /TAXON_ID=483367 /ORGANISM="non described non described, Strain CCMP 2436" /LENGTH=105 /DNA_ID=CAMNT_0021978191 /DNA_START=23 /DNA_END=341 /DNA_ORIENTATION=+